MSEITETEENLWQLLDDISTLFDQHKPVMSPFAEAVLRACEDRGLWLYSPDGFKLERTKRISNINK
jgi:hypothetical protein